MRQGISRRNLLKLGLAAGAGLAGLELLRRRSPLPPAARSLRPNRLAPGVFVARGEDPAALTRAAVNAAGGLDRLVARGDVVVIKPNIAWDRPPEMAANTNPGVVAELVRLCRAAGARAVKVFDRPVSPNPAPAYARSGIAAAARAAGADVHFVRPEGFREIAIHGGASLESWTFYDEALECDVLINVPIAKHHSASRLSLGLKNMFGLLGGDRGQLHRDIHGKIADVNRVLRADLTVVDAYRILRRHGPTGGRLADVDNSADQARRVIVCRDAVAADAYAASLFDLEPGDIGFISAAHAAGLGEIDWRALDWREIMVGQAEES